MSRIKDLFKNKIIEVTTQKNLNKGQKKKRLGAFVNNVFYMIDVIQTRENKKNDLLLNDEFARNITGEYSWVSMNQFEKKIKDRCLLQECKEFLKKEKLIDVLMKDGREYYIHFPHNDQGIGTCSKAYKLTEKCKDIIANTTEQEFDEFIKQVGIEERKKYTQPTPAEVMAGVEDNYWFSNTKKNIEKVLNNNLELEFHPTSVQEMVDFYNQQRKEEGEKELSKQQIQFAISQKIDEFANKDFSYNVRLYNAFTRTPRCWRKYVTTKEGKKIGELFDIHSSVLNILPLVCRIELLKNGQSTEKLDVEEQILNYKFEQGNIYKQIGGEEYSKQQIKDAMMRVLFSNNKSFENIANLDMTTGGKVKHTAANKIRMWLKGNFPVMFDVLAHFEEKYEKYSKSKWTKFKSQHWRAFQELETELMCELIVRVEKQFGVKIYGLHDGCFRETELYSTTTSDEMVKYCESEYKKLKEELKQIINQFYNISAPVENLKRLEKHLPVTEVPVELTEEEIDKLTEGI